MGNPCTNFCAGLILLCLASLPAARAQIYESEISVTGNDARAVDKRAQRSIRQQARAHESNAMLLAEAGRTTEAIVEDRAAIAADPDHPGYRILLASLLIDAGRLKCALHVYEYVCARFPEQTPYLAESMQQLRLVLNIMAIEHALGADDAPVEATSTSDCRPDSAVPEDEQVIFVLSREQTKPANYLHSKGADSIDSGRHRSSVVKRAASFLSRIGR